MKELFFNGKDTCLRNQMNKENNIKVKMQYAGICRTDILVSKGIIHSKPIVLGHEGSGTIIKEGIEKTVAIIPLTEKGFLGLDINGLFKNEFYIEEKYLLETTLDYKTAAFLEPVAAALSIRKKVHGKAAVLGENRIADLIKIILMKENIQIGSMSDTDNDCVIETIWDFKKIINALKPKGTIILKSRNYKPSEIIINELVRKEISLIPALYEDFKESLTWLEKNKEDVQCLFGKEYELKDFEKAFNEAEEKKSFFIFKG